MEDEDGVNGNRFEDVDTEMRDMKIKCRENRDREQHMKNKEEAIGIGTNFGDCRRSYNEESDNREKTEDDIAILNSLAEEGRLDEKVQVHGRMNGEESNNNPTKQPVVGV